MANKNEKVHGNVTGTYYVDNSCISCGMCEETAPKNFKVDDNGDFALVFKQPQNEEEQHACEEAKNTCPTEAIGDDGE